MTRAAIVGLGMWGRSLVQAVQSNRDALQFTVACTRTPANSAEFSAKHGITLVASYEEVLARPDIDAVVLATPNKQHPQEVEKAAAAGKHVFVEKPFALDSESAYRALDAVHKAGVVLGLGFTRRFHPAMLEVERRFKDGTLGALVSIVGQQTNMMAPFLNEHWRVDPEESPAGAMTAISVHTVDSMMQIAGPIAELHCLVERRASIMDDTTSILLSFVNGGSGLVFSSMSTARFARFAVYGSKGLIEVSGSRLESLEYLEAPTEPPTGPATPRAPERIEYPGFDMLRAELVEFANCICEGRRFPISDHDILHGVAVLEAAVESSRAGRPVAVKQQN